MFGYSGLDASLNRSYSLAKSDEALNFQKQKIWTRDNGNDSSYFFKHNPKIPNICIYIQYIFIGSGHSTSIAVLFL